MRVKKSLGQHFLRSERALSAIVKAGGVGKTDTVLEIGPGTGTLTTKLLAAGAKVVAVEKDDRLFKLLRQKFEKEIKNGKLELIHDDILNFQTFNLKTYKLIANIPYNITGAILKKFLSDDYQPELMVFLVQKEMAKRIVTTPLGSSASKWGENKRGKESKESILSISVKAYGIPRYLETVKAGSFAPRPKVDSAIIAIENISKDFFKTFSEKEFFGMVRVGFKSKRKKLSSNLGELFQKKDIGRVLKKLNLDENIRAEDVATETWQKLAQSLISKRQ